MDEHPKKDRIWIEDFRIYDTPDGRVVARLMAQWKKQRQRPLHFVRALTLYKHLIEGDIELFLEALIDIAPRTALKFIGKTIGSNGTIAHSASTTKQETQYEEPEIEYTEPTSEEKIDDLAASLGMDDISFD